MPTLLFLVCLLLGWCGMAHAVRTVHAEGAITIKLEIGQPSAMVFPEEISTITTAMPEARLMINKDQAYAGFVLKDPEMPRNRQIVTGMSGRIYMVYTEVAKTAKDVDDLVYVTHKIPSQADIASPLSLMRLVRSPKGPGSAQPLTLVLPTTHDPRITLSKPQQYSLGPYQALVLTVTNTQDHPLRLDERLGEDGEEAPMTARLATWAWPPKRKVELVAVEQDVLTPQGSTTLYIIVTER